MQKKFISTFIGFLILVGFAMPSRAVVNSTLPTRTISLSGFSPAGRLHSAQAVCKRYINTFAASPMWTGVQGFFLRSSTHLRDHRYAYGITAGSLLAGFGIVAGIRKIYELKGMVENVQSQANRHLLRIGVLENQVLKLSEEKEDLSRRLIDAVKRKIISRITSPDLINSNDLGNDLLNPGIEEDDFSAPLPPPIPDSLKAVDDAAQEITVNAPLILKDLKEALKQDDVESSVRAVFQKYPLIKNLDPRSLIEKASVNDSVMQNNLPPEQIIAIAQSLQHNKVVELTGALEGKGDQVKACVEKIARFLIRCFKNDQFGAEIDNGKKEQKKIFLMAKIDPSSVHLKKLPLQPNKKNVVLVGELEDKLKVRKQKTQDETCLLDQGREKRAQEIGNKLFKEEHGENTLLGQIEKGTKLKHVEINYEANKKEKEKTQILANPVFTGILEKFKNINVEDEDSDSDDDGSDSDEE